MRREEYKSLFGRGRRIEIRICTIYCGAAMNPDFYGHFSALSAREQEFLHRFRSMLRDHVEPIIDDHWNRGVFPQSVVESFGAFLKEVFEDNNIISSTYF